MLGRLLLLLGRRRRRSKPGLTALAGHDCGKYVVTDTDRRRLLRWACMLWRAAHGARRRASADVLELSAQMSNFFFVSG